MSTDLKLALDTTNGVALIPEDLEPQLADLALKQYPFLNILNVREANGVLHQFNRKTSYGSAYFNGEKASGTGTEGTTSRDSVAIKSIKTKRGVTGKMQSASKKYIDAYKDELFNALQAVSYKLEWGCFWGMARVAGGAATASGDPYYFTGFESGMSTNVVEKAGTLDLAAVDALIDPTMRYGAARDPKCFVMSSQMVSKLSGLDTGKFKIESGYEFPGGFRMQTYRGIPIYESAYCRELQVMTAAASADSASVGGLVAGKTYGYKVAKITEAGESTASSNTSHLVGAGKSAVDLTWAAASDALAYKIYRTKEDLAVHYFLAYVPAFTYDGNGDVTGLNAAFTDITADSGLNMARTPYAANEETIFLINHSKQNSYEYASLVDAFGEPVKNLFNLIPLGAVKDSRDFLLTHHGSLALKGEMFSSVLRRVKAV